MLLKKTTILTDEIFLELEIKEASGLLLPGNSASEAGTLTGQGFILMVGEGCSERIKSLKVGQRVQLRRTVDLNPYINVSQSNVEHLVPNPGCKLFYFGDKNDGFKKHPTALVHEWDIVAKIEE